MRPSLLALLLTLTACATPDTTPPADASPEPPPEAATVDVPARVEVACTPSACSCAGGVAGMRACLPNGELDACRCSAPPLDATGLPDADATAADAPIVADVSPDAGLVLDRGASCGDTQTDPANCGACGNVCTFGPNVVTRCVAGVCQNDGCRAGTVDCDGVCADRNTDPMNCGRCGERCQPVHAVPMCNTGRCAFTRCDEGFSDCDGNQANGCEVDLQTSVSNCGRCGVRCSSGFTCRMGVCS